jgi:type II secretory pathway component PulF
LWYNARQTILQTTFLAIMLFSPRMSLKQLAGFCQRASTSLMAGIDERTICAREARHAQGRALRRHLTAVSQMVNQGGTLSEGLEAGGDFFPPLLREMVYVGDQSGHLGEVLKELSHHYQNQITLRRNFLGAITWPAIELSLAVCVIGLLIWILGAINEKNHPVIDPLGWGLIGTDGLIKYAAIVTVIGVSVALVARAVSRGMLWTRPFQRLILGLPKIGSALQSVALARLTWVMSLTMNTTMDLRRSLKLALTSTRNAWYTDRIDTIDAQIAAGNSIYEAFAEAGGFPDDFLNTLHAAEESGKLVESMAHISNEYQDQAKSAMTILAQIAGFAVWIGVAAIIIVLIFRLAGFYVGVLNNAAQM